MPMVQDDLSIWLKASAENKITQKNAWQATLIDHFVDINSKGNVNFQKASCTLEGCMKVYSTRVDDVSDNTMKLLGIFNKEEDTKKKQQIKKKSNFIEKNLNHINLKEQNNDSFYDPLFSSILSRNDDYSLLDFLEPCDMGMVIYSHKSEDLVMAEAKVDFDLEILPICDSLKDFESLKSIETVKEDVAEPYLFDDDFNDNNNQLIDNTFNELTDVNQENFEGAEVCTEIEPKEINQFQETPFGYFKGWAGPSYWKSNLNLIRKPTSQTVKKVKQRYFLDFKMPLDYTILETKSDTIMSKEAILERRKSKNFLPEDYSYETKDLYRFHIRDGYFGIFRSNNSEMNLENGRNIIEDNTDMNDGFEFNDQPFDPDLSFQMERSLNLNNNLEEAIPSTLKFTRVAKKVDIKKLKENVNKMIEEKTFKLSDIFNKVGQFYHSKEAKEISPHLCLISLLHLANEKGLQITQKSDDLIIN